MRKVLLIFSMVFALSVINAGAQTFSQSFDTDSLINEIEVYSDTASNGAAYWDADDMSPDDDELEDMQEWEAAYSSGFSSIVEGILTFISVVGIVAVVILIILFVLPIVMIGLIIWLWTQNRHLKERIRILEMNRMNNRNHMP